MYTTERILWLKSCSRAGRMSYPALRALYWHFVFQDNDPTYDRKMLQLFAASTPFQRRVRRCVLGGWNTTDQVWRSVGDSGIDCGDDCSLTLFQRYQSW